MFLNLMKICFCFQNLRLNVSPACSISGYPFTWPLPIFFNSLHASLKHFWDSLNFGSVVRSTFLPLSCRHLVKPFLRFLKLEIVYLSGYRSLLVFFASSCSSFDSACLCVRTSNQKSHKMSSNCSSG